MRYSTGLRPSAFNRDTNIVEENNIAIYQAFEFLDVTNKGTADTIKSWPAKIACKLFLDKRAENRNLEVKEIMLRPKEVV